MSDTMQSVPKIVLKRLKERVATGESHPDADLLTAFAERSLGGSERAVVMEHLSVCGDCRDVVALALPTTESIAPEVSLRSNRLGWFAWPALRWGALAAGILVVISVGVLQYSHRSREKTVASNLIQKNEVSVTSAETSQPDVPSVAGKTGVTDRQSTVHELTSNRIAAVRRGSGAPIGGGSGGGMAVGAFRASSGANAVSSNRGAASPQVSETTLQAQSAAPAIQQPARVGASSTMVEVQSAAGPASTQSAAVAIPQNQIGQNQTAQNQVPPNQVAPNEVAQNQADVPIAGRKVTALDIVKAKDPVPAQGGSSVQGGSLQASSVMVRESPRWTVTSEGALQRSFDGGNTWENVVPSEAEGNHPANAMAARSMVAPDKLGEQDKLAAKKDEKASATVNASPVFRAVAASGLEVWAGAYGGLLYHTSDGGIRWARVIPAEGGSILTGDITSIGFPDPQHGKVGTSTNELWTTTDTGRTWRKQP